MVIIVQKSPDFEAADVPVLGCSRRRGVAQPVDESYCFRRHGIEAPNKRPVHESLRCDDDVDTAAKQPSRSAQLPGSSKLTQTYLDLGQKNFFPIRCPSCGFVYTPGKRQDEKLHEEYHRGSSVLKYHSCKDDVEIFKDGKAGRILRVHWDRLSTSVSSDNRNDTCYCCCSCS